MKSGGRFGVRAVSKGSEGHSCPGPCQMSHAERLLLAAHGIAVGRALRLPQMSPDEATEAVALQPKGVGAGRGNGCLRARQLMGGLGGRSSVSRRKRRRAASTPRRFATTDVLGGVGRPARERITDALTYRPLTHWFTESPASPKSPSSRSWRCSTAREPRDGGGLPLRVTGRWGRTGCGRSG